MHAWQLVITALGVLLTSMFLCSLRIFTYTLNCFNIVRSVHTYIVSTLQAIGLNQGLLIGIGCAVVSFVLSYASESMHTMQRVYKRSRVVRPASQRRVLAIHRDKILCMEVGYT
jgi:hypothetical protein